MDYTGLNAEGSHETTNPFETECVAKPGCFLCVIGGVSWLRPGPTRERFIQAYLGHRNIQNTTRYINLF